MSDHKRDPILPVFIQNSGCIKRCIFCNQKNISGGQRELDNTFVSELLEQFSAKNPGRKATLAFYGGSFSNLPSELKTSLLTQTQPFTQQGLLSGIRISTTPESITKEELLFLKGFGVDTIELGVQTMDDKILKNCNRNYNEKTVLFATALIKKEKVKLGIHLMAGLPGDSFDNTLLSAKKIARLKPDFVRLHPTLVILETALQELYEKGQYTPLTLEEAVEIIASMLKIFYLADINVARVGLHIDEVMKEKNTIVAGPVHPAFKQLAEGKIYLELFENWLKNHQEQIKEIEIGLGETSNFTGHKKANIIYFKTKYGIELSGIKENQFLKKYTLLINKVLVKIVD